MQLAPFPFQITDWNLIEAIEHQGITGFARWKTIWVNDIRIRKVDYSADYMADHWCEKGHIIFCISGEMTTELSDGRKMNLTAGMSYQVGDGSNAHRSFSKTGCCLFIVD